MLDKLASCCVLSAAMFAHAACTPSPRPDGATGSAGDMGGADTAAVSTAEPTWTVTPAGFGPLRAGMSVTEARAALGTRFAAADSMAGCTHVPVTAGAGRVLAMVVDGRVARIEVKDSAVATAAGARVGDSEARIDSLYRGRVQEQPHKYTDGHYLTVTPEAAADSAQRLIFETDGRKVLEYRAGLMPAVAWVEGCS